METLGRRAHRKVRDIPIASAHPADVKAWLPGYADALATMVALTLAELIEAGWNLGDLSRLARAMRTRGLLERVVEQVYAQVPYVPLGKAKVKSFVMGSPVTHALPRAKVSSFTMGEPIGGSPTHAQAPRAKVSRFTMAEPIGGSPTHAPAPRAKVSSFTMAEPIGGSPAHAPAPRAKVSSFTMGEPIDMTDGKK